MEKIFNIEITESEKDYLMTVLASLQEIQKKIPKKMKTKNSELLHTIYNKLREL